MASDDAKDGKNLSVSGDAAAVSPPSPKKAATTEGKARRRKGLFARLWGLVFRSNEDFEKRLQYLSKEEASVHARVKRRAQSWRKMARNLIVFSVLLEVGAVIYAVITTRVLDLDWKIRAARVLPMFIWPGLSFVIYSSLASFTRMRNQKDQKTLERLRAERQEKIDELKERTNYYTTQQLIQRYDLDPAAKAAAASVLAHKLGADSGLKVYVGDNNDNQPAGKSNDVQIGQSSGLRKRRPAHSRDSSAGSVVMPQIEEEKNTQELEPEEMGSPNNQTIMVGHHQPTQTKDGGWFARLAALLVGEDPTQCYALICGNCRMHNGLARKEDFPYITYYCPHCHALNGSQQLKEQSSGDSSNISRQPSGDVDKITSDISQLESSPKDDAVASTS